MTDATFRFSTAFTSQTLVRRGEIETPPQERGLSGFTVSNIVDQQTKADVLTRDLKSLSRRIPDFKPHVEIPHSSTGCEKDWDVPV